MYVQNLSPPPRKLGPFETFGIAGFFGLPIATSELGSNDSHPSLPVILKPKHQIKELTDEKEFKIINNARR